MGILAVRAELLISARSVHGMPDILGMIVHFRVLESLPPSRDGCAAFTYWLSLSGRKTQFVDPAREDVDGFDSYLEPV